MLLCVWKIQSSNYLRPLASEPARSASVTVASVRRDGEWKDLPVALLVRGDVVGLLPLEAAPCALTTVGNQKMLLAAVFFCLCSPVF
jgi:magnesium-transporting ATPase (P-type)